MVVQHTSLWNKAAALFGCETGVREALTNLYLRMLDFLLHAAERFGKTRLSQLTFFSMPRLQLIHERAYTDLAVQRDSAHRFALESDKGWRKDSEIFKKPRSSYFRKHKWKVSDSRPQELHQLRRRSRLTASCRQQ